MLTQNEDKFLTNLYDIIINNELNLILSKFRYNNRHVDYIRATLYFNVDELKYIGITYYESGPNTAKTLFEEGNIPIIKIDMGISLPKEWTNLSVQTKTLLQHPDFRINFITNVELEDCINTNMNLNDIKNDRIQILKNKITFFENIKKSMNEHYRIPNLHSY